MVSCPLFVKGGTKISHVNGGGGIFSEILLGEQKGGIFCCSSVEGTSQGWSIFLYSVAKITFPHPHFTGHKCSYSCYVMTDHHAILFFISILLLFSSTTSADFHPIFTIHNMEKCEHTFEKHTSERLKTNDFPFEIKTVTYSLVNYFLVLGIWLQTGHVYLRIWYISLLLLSCFCSW